MKVDSRKRFSTNVNVDGYDYAVGSCRLFLCFLGAWPDPYHDSNWTSNTRILIATLTMFLFATLSQTIKLLMSYKNLNVIIEILSNCDIPTTIAMVKIISIWYHRYVLKDLLRQIIEDWKMPHTSHELTIMWKNAKISRFFTIGCLFMTESTLVAQCIVGFLGPAAYIMGKSIANKSVEWPLYMMGWFPYDTQMSIYYELTMLGQFMSNVFASTSFSSADSFFVILMFHLIGQLSILKLTIYDLSRQIQNEDDRRQFMDQFDFVHSMHTRLWRFSSAIEQSFNMMFLIQLVPCIFGLCAQGFQLIMITGAECISVMDLIFMTYFLVLFLFTLFTYCYVTEILRRKSVEISYAVYDSDWTILPAREAKLLVLLITRAQHPFEITAGKFVSFSLKLYCRILKTSVGYLSMLLAVKDRMIERSE
ncbi:odorant receptor 49b-like [Phymastichus coffea]|uniref:odorant receptor 49b-like n=1 Tax=Phymastichus coffea TaxID=108790 RepID=UPI00273A7682|nr:odorant receptor 49b-like [Phymastichus coffea]